MIDLRRLVNLNPDLMPKSNERLLCEDYCKQYPQMKSLTLAKKIFIENHKKMPGLKNIEHVRRAFVNAVRGKNGKGNRDYAADKSQFQPTTYDTTNYKPFKEEIDVAKILILDIETAPIRAYVWGIWQQNVSLNQIESDWFCLTWSAKWLFDKKVYSASLTGKEAIKQDDKRIIKSLWALLNEADIVIAHNAEKFDIPKINSRFIIHKLNPPLPYLVIDTLKHIRRQFGFSSNKLDYVNKLLNLPRKMENEGFELWGKCYKGDESALKKMLVYNIQDVKILEETYLRIRSWIKPHPNIGLYILDKVERCPSCGSGEIIKDKRYYYTSVNRFEAFRCDNCGSTGRVRTSDVKITERRFLTTSLAR